MDFVDPDKVIDPQLSRAEVAQLAVIVHSSSARHIADRYWKEAATHAELEAKLFRSLAASK